MQKDCCSKDRMYVRLWGVTFMSDCEVILRPSGASLVWALNVRLVFLFVSVPGSLGWLSLFLALVFGVSAAAPALAPPSNWCLDAMDYYLLWFYFCVMQCPRLGTSWLPPGGLLTLSGFFAVFRAGWTIVQRFSDEVPL